MIAFGDRLPAWANTAVDDYLQRLPRQYALDLRQLPLSRRSDARALERQRVQEDEKMVGAIASDELVIGLDEKGKQWSTRDFAGRLGQWQQDGRNCCFLIGGPEGLGEKSRGRADLMMSLSAFTLPHSLARVMLAEQWYRAWSLHAGHPYHRE